LKVYICSWLVLRAVPSILNEVCNHLRLYIGLSQ